MRLVDLKTQALRYLALGEHEQALLIYRAIVRHLPTDLDARMKVADALAHMGEKDLACRVYAAVAWCDLQAGRPLHALVCGQALLDLGQDPASIHQSLVALYGADSPRRGRPGSGRFRPPDGDSPVGAVDLTPLPGNLAAESAAEVAADTESFTAFPQQLGPVPLLSDLAGEPLLRLCQAALIRRVGPRQALFKEGSPAYSLYLVACGTVEVFREGPPRKVLLRLGEGQLLGERALLTPLGRPASAESCEPTDYVELPLRALRAACAESAQATRALERLVRDRLLRQLLGGSPIFAALTTGQRLDLLRRFGALELAEESVLVREGEVPDGLYVLLSGRLEAIRGAEPFETVLGPIEPGDVIGELGLHRPQPATATLRVVQAAQVALLHRETFDKVIATLPAAQRHLQALPQEAQRQLQGLSRSLLCKPGAPLTLEEDEERRAEFPLLL